VTDAKLVRSAYLDALFDGSDAFGRDLAAYRNHAHRVFNFACALAPPGPEMERKVAVASYFHDIGIWTDRTFDYLAPSIQRASAYLEAHDLRAWTPEITAMIAEHHKVTPARADLPLVEAFRKADWIDVSLGLRRFGMSRAFVHEVRHAFPNAGFHRRLVTLTWERTRRHPLSPLPMFKW